MGSIKLGFIGSGKMATAIARGVVNCGWIRGQEILASDISSPALSSFVSYIPGAKTTQDNREVVRQSPVVILAVKPQDVPQVILPLRDSLSSCLLISIAAGIRIKDLSLLTQSGRVIRVMPNTPAMVQKGVAVYACGDLVSEEDQDICRRIFSALGWVQEVPEEWFDIVTAVSGSGPAFLFRYIEAMVTTAKNLGLPENLAEKLVVYTVQGAIEMVCRNLGTPAELRMAVTSKRGTTEAGLSSLDRDNFEAIIQRCIQAATDRSRALGEEFSQQIQKLL